MSDVFDIFLSYAHKDNETGWISALHRQLRDDSREQKREFQIFLDTSHIHTMDDWDLRIKDGLRQARLLVVGLSPHYLASEFCRREWDDFVVRTATTAGETKASVLLVDLPEDDPADKWRTHLEQIQYTNLVQWFTEDPEVALTDPEVRRLIRDLGDELYERLERRELALKVPGNLTSASRDFVGRNDELRQLSVAIRTQEAPVTIVHGFGGMGKTELVLQYAQMDRHLFKGGVWQIEAEGERSLLPALAKLASDPQLGVVMPENAKGDAAKEGLVVLHALRQRCSGPGDVRALVFLDNVTESSLLSAQELATIPDEPWLSLVATTRPGHAGLNQPGKSAYVAVDKLDSHAALELLRNRQPARGKDAHHRDFAPGQESAAKELVELLDGFTLALEQAAIYLGTEDESITDYVARLRAQGVAAFEQDLDDEVTDKIRHLGHKESLLSVILDDTLASMEAADKTAVLYAALFPPDTVPWPWLQELTLAEHPEAEREWNKIRRRLRSQRLVVSDASAEIASVHRLIAGLLETKEGREQRVAQVQALLVQVAAQIREYAPTAPWAPAALVAAALHLPAMPGLDEQLGYAFPALTERLPISLTGDLATALHDRWRSRLAEDQNDPAFERQLSVSLDNIGRVAMAAGDLAGARAAYTESLTIARRLAEQDQGSAQAARDVSVSLNNIGRVAMAAGDLAGARAAYTESLTIRRRLAEQDQGSAQAARDVSVSLWCLAELADLADGEGSEAARAAWIEVARHFTEQRQRGWIMPSDEKAEAHAHRRAQG